MRSQHGAGTCQKTMSVASVAFSLMEPVRPANTLGTNAPCVRKPLMPDSAQLLTSSLSDWKMRPFVSYGKQLAVIYLTLEKALLTDFSYFSALSPDVDPTRFIQGVMPNVPAK